jgi:hypothetical protein
MVRVGVATGVTVTKGDAMVDNGSGYLTNAASSTAVDVPYVAMETVVTTADGQLVEMCRTKGVIFEADTDNAPAQTDVGTRCDLATVSTVNPDAASNNLFYIESIKGATTDKKVIGWFVEGVPNS